MLQLSMPENDKTSKLKTPKMLAMSRKKEEKSTPVRTDGMLAMICKSERRIFSCPKILFMHLTFFCLANFPLLRRMKKRTRRKRRKHEESMGIKA